MTDLLLRGRAWVYPDNVAIDGDIMALEFALKRETRPDFLKDHVFAGLDPDFPKRARPGDIVVGGRRFAQGGHEVTRKAHRSWDFPGRSRASGPDSLPAKSLATRGAKSPPAQ